MLGGVFNNALIQIVLYNLFGQLVGAAVTPAALSIQQEVYRVDPVVTLTPDQLAAAVVRGFMGRGPAVAEARLSGVDADRFGVMEHLAGSSPAPMDLAVAYRRKLIDRGELDDGLQQSGLRSEWHGLIRQLSVQLPPPELALNAYLEGQVPEGRARDLYALFGGDPDYFDVAYDTVGQAPTPLDAATMARRGIIPWTGRGPHVTSYEQAFLEGPWRNKWLDPIRQLSEYLPPPRTVVAMYREGSLTRARAAELLAQQNLQPDLVNAYLTSATETKVKATKDLALTTIRQLYADLIISRADALDYIIGLDYAHDEADLILQVEDLRITQRYVGLAVGRVRTTYVGHKIDKATAVSALNHLGLAADQVSDLLGIWDLELDLNTRTLTPAEIFGAYRLGIYTQAQAAGELVALGYTPTDAWIYLSVHAKAVLGDQPAAGQLATSGQ